MRKMGIEALGPKPRTSKADDECHQIIGHETRKDGLEVDYAELVEQHRQRSDEGHHDGVPMDPQARQ
jgi:hypothetical protein